MNIDEKGIKSCGGFILRDGHYMLRIRIYNISKDVMLMPLTALSIQRCVQHDY